MQFWVTARFEGGKVSASVAASQEYDDGRTVTTTVAVEDGGLLDQLGRLLGDIQGQHEAAVVRRARFDAATMIVASGDEGLRVGGELKVAGTAAPQKRGR